MDVTKKLAPGAWYLLKEGEPVKLVSRYEGPRLITTSKIYQTCFWMPSLAMIQFKKPYNGGVYWIYIHESLVVK